MTKVGQIVFIGGGNITAAIVEGLLLGQPQRRRTTDRPKEVTADQVAASDPDGARRALLSERFGIQTFDNNRTAVQGARMVVLAIKPTLVDDVLSEIAADLPQHTVVVSLVAGLTIDVIKRFVPDNPVVRAMPNVGAAVRDAATVITAAKDVSAETIAMVEHFFSAVGAVVVIEEKLMHAATGVSGSGPAYVYLVIEALADAGVKMGLNRAHSRLLACQTVLGAARLAIESGLHTGQLKDMVCSPGGTTISAVHVLEQGGLRTALMNAVEAATHRSLTLATAMRERREVPED